MTDIKREPVPRPDELSLGCIRGNHLLGCTRLEACGCECHLKDTRVIGAKCWHDDHDQCECPTCRCTCHAQPVEKPVEKVMHDQLFDRKTVCCGITSSEMLERGEKWTFDLYRVTCKGKESVESKPKRVVGVTRKKAEVHQAEDDGYGYTPPAVFPHMHEHGAMQRIHDDIPALADHLRKNHGVGRTIGESFNRLRERHEADHRGDPSLTPLQASSPACEHWSDVLKKHCNRPVGHKGLHVLHKRPGGEQPLIWDEDGKPTEQTGLRWNAALKKARAEVSASAASVDDMSENSTEAPVLPPDTITVPRREMQEIERQIDALREQSVQLASDSSNKQTVIDNLRQQIGGTTPPTTGHLNRNDLGRDIVVTDGRGDVLACGLVVSVSHDDDGIDLRLRTAYGDVQFAHSRALPIVVRLPRTPGSGGQGAQTAENASQGISEGSVVGACGQTSPQIVKGGAVSTCDREKGHPGEHRDIGTDTRWTEREQCRSVLTELNPLIRRRCGRAAGHPSYHHEEEGTPHYAKYVWNDEAVGVQYLPEEVSS